MESFSLFVVIKEFVHLGKVLVQTEQICHATPGNTLGLHSVLAQLPEVNVYVICVLWAMSVPSRMMINKTIIMWRTKDSLDNVEVKAISAIQPLLGLVEESFQVRSW